MRVLNRTVVAALALASVAAFGLSACSATPTEAPPKSDTSTAPTLSGDPCPHRTTIDE